MMFLKNKFYFALIGIGLFIIVTGSCKNDKSDPEPIAIDTKYPPHIEAIIKTKY